MSLLFHPPYTIFLLSQAIQSHKDHYSTGVHRQQRPEIMTKEKVYSILNHSLATMQYKDFVYLFNFYLWTSNLQNTLYQFMQ